MARVTLTNPNIPGARISVEDVSVAHYLPGGWQLEETPADADVKPSKTTATKPAQTKEK